MRKKIVAGNWKMNLTFPEAEDLIGDIAEILDDKELGCDVIICPPSPYLEMASDYAEESVIAVGAQNVNENKSGAYTGEISASMIRSVDVPYCIVGHSERRKYYNESNELLASKVEALLDYEISPIFCIGELLEEREAEKHFDVVKSQLEKGLFNLNEDEFSNIIIAYEPVWAIGTGKVATPEQAQEMHKFIRNTIEEKYGKETAENTTILYGGSCKPSNAADLFANEDVDGGLIGGASLVADDFVKIIEAFSK